MTEVAETVIVYVDENGAPYSTTTEARVASTVSSVAVSTTSVAAVTTTVSISSSQVLSTSASSSAVPSFDFASVKKLVAPSWSSAPYVAPSSTPQETQPSTTPPPPAPTSETPSSSAAPTPLSSSAPPPSAPAAPSPSSSSAPAHTNDNSGALGIGITYDPFVTGSGCKTDDEFAADFEKMKDYKNVRLYGQGCNQIPLAVKAAQKHNQKLMAGTYMSNRQDVAEDLGDSIRAWKSAIDRYAGGNWDIVSLFSVENERVNERDMTASAVVDAINRAREQLHAAGYNGPVGAVETVPAMFDNPAICEASDVVMVNCHAFFDTNTPAEAAGKFVRSEIDRIGKACGGKRVVVTESGWPHQGDPNGQAIPSPDNQRTALESIRATFSGDMFLHNAFDSLWKSDSMATFNAERYWGIIQ